MDHPGTDMGRLTSDVRFGPRSDPRTAAKRSSLFGLLALGGWLALHFASGYASGAAYIGDRFLDAMGSHDYRTALSLCAGDSGASAPSLERREASVERREGRYVSHGPSGWRIVHEAGETTVRLTYQVRYAQGEERVRLVMAPVGGQWRVSDYVYPPSE